MDFNYPWANNRRYPVWMTRFIPCLGTHLGTLHRGYGFWLTHKNKRKGN